MSRAGTGGGKKMQIANCKLCGIRSALSVRMRVFKTRGESPHVVCYKSCLQSEDAVESGEDAVASEDFEQMVEAWTDGTTGCGHAHGMDEQA